MTSKGEEMTEEMKFPPPPRGVQMQPPDGPEKTIRAYTKEGVPRLVWNPKEGSWEVDPNVAHWELNTSDGWTLVTNTVREKANSSQKSYARIRALEGQLKIHEHRIIKLEQELLLAKEAIDELVGLALGMTEIAKDPDS